MPMEWFRDILDEYFSNDEVQRQVETALNWGRYANIFTYDSETDRLMPYNSSLSEDGQALPLH